MINLKYSDLKHEVGSSLKDLQTESDLKLTTKFQNLSGLLHECPQCGYVVTRKERLNRHIEYEHKGVDWRYKCDKCNERFKDRETLNVHVKLDHEKSFYMCEEGCDVKYLCRSSIRDHINKVHRGRQVFCTKCDYISHSQFNVDQHFKRKHLQVVPKCSLCDFSSKTPQILLKHRREVHNILPQPRFRRRRDLLGEKQLVPTVHKCDSCEYIAPNSYILNLHRDGKHGEKKECQQCDKSFQYTNDLKEHIKVIHNGIKKKCPHCDFQCDFKSAFRRHMKANHAISNLKCEICNELFIQKGRLNIHKSVVHEGKILECEQCDYTYTSFDAINGHRRRKHSNNPNREKKKCQQCDKSFKYTHDLKKHIKVIHEGIKKKCPHCDFQADFNSGLKKHMTSVHGISNLKCDICNELFVVKGELNFHISVVHEGKILECELCDYIYSSFVAINAHRRRKHSNNGTKIPSSNSKTKKQKQKTMKIDIKEVLNFDFELNEGEEMKLDSDMKEENMGDYDHEVDLRFACLYCSEEFTTTEKMRTHIASHI